MKVFQTQQILFLFALKKGRFQGGKHDTDLLPDNHPVKKEMEDKRNKRSLDLNRIAETDMSNDMRLVRHRNGVYEDDQDDDRDYDHDDEHGDEP